MLLLILPAIFALVFLVLLVKYEDEDVFVPLILGSLSLLLVATLVIPFCYIGSNAEKSKLQIRYDSLVYQYENHIYEDNYSKKLLADDIIEWNEEITKSKMLSHNVWTGVYIPNIYDDFETISLDVLKEDE